MSVKPVNAWILVLYIDIFIVWIDILNNYQQNPGTEHCVKELLTQKSSLTLACYTDDLSLVELARRRSTRLLQTKRFAPSPPSPYPIPLPPLTYLPL